MSSSLNIDDLLRDLENSAIEKKASVQEPLAVSAEIIASMEKQAKLDVTTQAIRMGEDLARTLLEKVANQINVDNQVMAAEQAAAVAETPEGTAEGVMQGLVNQALNQGAVSEDRVDPSEDAAGHANVEVPVEDAQITAPEAALKEEDMAKQASETGASLAQMLLTKVAEQLGEAPVVNKIQEDTAIAAAQKEQAIAPAPEGTANQILQALVAAAQSTGAGSDDMTDAVVAQEGAAQTSNPAQVSTGTEVEKAAAVIALVNEGVDFESAVDMVKQAEAEIVADDEFEKAAAVTALVEHGIGFADAVDLVKQAEEELLKEAGLGATLASRAAAAANSVRGSAQGLKDGLQNVASAAKANGGVFNKGTLSTVKALGRNGIVQGAGVAGALGLAGAGVGAMANRMQEKRAAFDALVDAGVDYSEAAALVEAAEQEVYGN